MYLDKNTKRHLTLFPEQLNNNLNNWTFNVSRNEKFVYGYAENFKIEQGLDEIIKVFENDLQTAKEVSLYMCIPENCNFLQSDILVNIEKMIKPNCNIDFILFANDKNITSTSLKIKIYNKAKNILLKEIHELPN